MYTHIYVEVVTYMVFTYISVKSSDVHVLVFSRAKQDLVLEAKIADSIPVQPVQLILFLIPRWNP